MEHLRDSPNSKLQVKSSIIFAICYYKLKLYLENLLTRGLLSVESNAEGSEERTLILLTQKGYSFIAEYRKMKNLIEPFGI